MVDAQVLDGARQDAAQQPFVDPTAAQVGIGLVVGHLAQLVDEVPAESRGPGRLLVAQLRRQQVSQSAQLRRLSSASLAES